MAHSEERNNNDLQFHWGQKRGVGGANKDIQFYKSFMFDGIDYSLYDCVYLSKEGELEPYIGKILKIWEQPDHQKKVKILWFFRPNKLLNYLGDHAPLENEIFLASGEGVGAFNVNPLEAIAGKCSVICSSKDERNPQPSIEALKLADYIFCRTFDVGSFIISEKIPDNIVGVEVKYLLNRVEDCKPSSLSKLEPNVFDGKGVADESSVSRNVFMRLLENKVEDEKRGHVPSSKSREDVNERKQGKHFSNEKSASKSKNDLIDNEGEESKAAVSHARNLESCKRKDDPSLSDDKSSKKMRPSDDPLRPSNDLQNKNGTVTRKPTIENDGDSDGEDFVRLHKESSEHIMLSKKKASSAVSLENDTKADNRAVEVTRRPDADRSKWFKQAPLQSRIQNADGKGTLVFLDNLDPSYTSGHIEDVMYHAFKESCTARVIQQATFQSPHYGQAYVTFKTPNAADLAVQKINMGCLMLPNGRPLVASRGMLKIPRKSSTLTGHLTIEKIRLQLQREEWKKAVSTSHCSQPNTIEYEMAMDWLLVQEKSCVWFNQLHKRHGDDRNQVMKSLKTK